jgi:hypothetical protein
MWHLCGWLFLVLLSPVPIAKYGQFESLSAWSIGLDVESIFSHCLAGWSVFFRIAGNGLALGEGGDFQI